MPQLFLTNTLARRVEGVPGLVGALRELEGGLIERAWHAAAARDPDGASALGARLGRLIGPRLPKHQHVVANLRTAFPHWLPHRAEAVAARVWAGIGRMLLEFPVLERICDPIEQRVRIVDHGGLEDVIRSGRPGIFVAGHLANWHILPASAAHRGVPLSVVYRPQRNPVIERLLSGWRDALGCRFLAVDEATRPLIRELESGHSVGLIMDQRYDRGEQIPFFGRPATTTTVPARLALKFGMPLLPTRIQRLRGARFVITVHRPVKPAPGLTRDESARHMTAAVNSLLERWITAAPEQWFCTKRRWPRQRSRMPRRGKISLT